MLYDGSTTISFRSIGPVGSEREVYGHAAGIGQSGPIRRDCELGDYCPNFRATDRGRRIDLST
jgi:hypothetical protein